MHQGRNLRGDKIELEARVHIHLYSLYGISYTNRVYQADRNRDELATERQSGLLNGALSSVEKTLELIQLHALAEAASRH